MAAGPRIVAFGVAVLGSVIAWRLAGSSYAADVATICQAEARSGLAMRRDMSGVTDWVRANLATPEGNELYSALGDVPLQDRADRLRAAAAASKVGPCPMVEAYEGLIAEGQYRADLQRLCSTVTFPGLRDLGPDARLDVLERWIETEAKSRRTSDLAQPLRDATTPEDQARILAEAAKAIDVLTCDTAKMLATPSPDAAAF